jgi:hypothetical protein
MLDAVPIRRNAARVLTVNPTERGLGITDNAIYPALPKPVSGYIHAGVAALQNTGVVTAVRNSLFYLVG